MRFTQIYNLPQLKSKKIFRQYKHLNTEIMLILLVMELLLGEPQSESAFPYLDS